MVRALGLPFDPIERAGEHWAERFGPASGMRAATSVFRVQQILLARFDEVLRPLNLTFARYEVLVLLTFSRRGELPLKVIGSRLMVHPTSVTNAIDRLVAAGYVSRRPNPADGGWSTRPPPRSATWTSGWPTYPRPSAASSSTCSSGCASAPATSRTPSRWSTADSRTS